MRERERIDRTHRTLALAVRRQATGAGPRPELRVEPRSALALQRLAGNQATMRALQLAAHEEQREDMVREAVADRGSALPEDVQRTLAGVHGVEPEAFSHVRVHTGEAAHEAAGAVGATAFRTGSHLVFRRAAYDPASAEGLATLTHETAHVLGGRPPVPSGHRGMWVSDPDHAEERAAEGLRGPTAVTGVADGVRRRGPQAAPLSADRSVDASASSPAVQRRLPTSSTFEQKIKLSRNRKGKSDGDIAGFVAQLKAYEDRPRNWTPERRVDHLLALRRSIRAWLTGKGKSSRRKKPIIALDRELANEVGSISTEDLAADPHMAGGKETGLKLGGQQNQIIGVDYDFGPEEEGGDDEVFHGLFKAEPDRTAEGAPKLPERATASAITGENENLTGRNLATYRVAVLLGADVITPTYRARHKGVQGIVMKKVEGRTGLEEKVDKKNADVVDDPVFRQCMSNLYLIDLICGQVDRHHGNYMVERNKSGKIIGVKGIDNDLSFGAQYKDLGKKMVPTGYEELAGGATPLHERDKKATFFRGRRYFYNGKLMDELTEIDAKMAANVIDLSKRSGDLRKALRGLVGDKEIDAAIGRLKSLAKFLQKLVRDKDDKIVAKWE